MDRSAEITNRDAGPAPSPVPPAVEPEDRLRKRRKTTHGGRSPSSLPPPLPPSPPASRWRNGWEQQIFSSKLLSALRLVRGSGVPSSASTPAALPRSRAVRDASDRILAAAAGGRSRWSRAVLRRHRAACRKARARRAAYPEPHGPAAGAALLERRRRAAGGGNGGNVDDLSAKAKVLGRLVPGCRKASFPSLLEEASDYIAALEMQVRAMSALAEMLSSMGSGSGTIAGSSSPTSTAGPSRL